MFDRISYFTYGAALNAAGGVLLYYNGHPVVAAVNAAVTVITITNAFREIANSLTNKIKEARDNIEETIEAESDRITLQRPVPNRKASHVAQFTG
jgi:hypothetical protein